MPTRRFGNLSGLPTVFGTGATAACGLILVPAYAIYRFANNRKVNKKIISRKAQLPFELRANQMEGLHFFFPLTPSPRQVEITYIDSLGEHTLTIDTNAALQRLAFGKREEMTPSDKLTPTN